MSIPTQSRFRAAALLLGLLLWGCPALLRGQEPEVSATLSQSTTTPGSPVELRLVIRGTDKARVPRDVPTPDLEIVHVGQSNEFNMTNGRIDARVIHTYHITASRTGTFTIPEILVEAGGKKLKTAPLTLTVQGSASPPSGSAAGGTGSAGGELDEWVFAQLVPAKESAYVGELIPVEIRIFIEPSLRARAEAGPTLTGEGFTQKPMLRVRSAEQQVDGRRYEVTVFQTHITPAKAGSLALGPGELPAVIQIPQRQRRAPRSGIFDDDFFNDPFGMMQQQRVRIRTGTTNLEVKPLPPTGRPPSFSGAVGTFEAQLEATPTTAQVGDPITLKLIVTGRGDFDRVQAPELPPMPGWKPYPATAKFEPSDEAHSRGTKTFELVLIPETNHRMTPALEFSFYDPEKEAYQSIALAPIPLQISGSPRNPEPARSATSPLSPVPTPPPATAGPTPSAPELLHVLPDPGSEITGDPLPLWRSPAFVSANAAAAVLAAALFAAGIARRQRSGPARAQARQLRHRQAQALRALASGGGPDRIEAAIEAVRATTALRAPGLVEPADPETIARRLELAPTQRDRLLELFRIRDRARYGAARPELPDDLVTFVHDLARN